MNRTTSSLFVILMMGILLTSCAGEGKADEVSENETANENTEVLEKTTSETDAEEIADQATDEIDWETYEAYNLTEVDTPPLFAADCSTEKNPRECSDIKLMAYITEHMVQPKGWNKKSLEQVLVIIEKDGSLKGAKYVASGNSEGCPECQQAAVDVVGKIKQWTPAIKDGKPVASKMSIPVRFG